MLWMEGGSIHAYLRITCDAIQVKRDDGLLKEDNVR